MPDRKNPLQFNPPTQGFFGQGAPGVLPQLPPAQVGPQGASLNIPGMAPPTMSQPGAQQGQQGGGFLQMLLQMLQKPEIQNLIGSGIAGGFGTGSDVQNFQQLFAQQQALKGQQQERDLAQSNLKIQQNRQTASDVREERRLGISEENLGLAKTSAQRTAESAIKTEKREGEAQTRLNRTAALQQAQTFLEDNPAFDLSTVPFISSYLGEPERRALQVGAAQNFGIKGLDDLGKLVETQTKLEERVVQALSRDPNASIDSILPPGPARDLLGEQFMEGMVREAARLGDLDYAERSKALSDAAKAQLLTVPLTEGVRHLKITGTPGDFTLEPMGDDVPPQLPATPGGLDFPGQIESYANALENGTILASAIPKSILADVLFSFQEQGKQLPLKDSDSSALLSADAALDILAEVELLVDAVITKSGPAAILFGGLREIAAAFNLDPDVSRLKSQIAFVGNLARSTGQRGNLSEGEQERMLLLLPTDPKMDAEVARANLSEFKRILLKARSNILRGRSIKDLQREDAVESYNFQDGVLIPAGAAP